MLTRSLLLHVPGLPLPLSALMPQRDLAVFASSLTRSGHWTRVADWGTLTGLRLLYEQAPTAPAPRLMGALMRSLRRSSAPIPHLAPVLDSVSETLGLDFVVVQAAEQQDMGPALALAQGLKQRLPKLPIVLTGRHAHSWASVLLTGETPFAAIIAPDAPASLAVMAETIDTPDLWPCLPGVHTAEGYRNAMRPTASPRPAAVPPCYDREIYPDIHPEEKLLYFTVQGTCAAPPSSARGSAPENTSLDGLEGELNAIAAYWPHAAIDLPGLPRSPVEVEQFSALLRKKYPGFRYSRQLSAAAGMGDTAPGLVASGCMVAELSLWTGSQRLLEDFYGGAGSASAALQLMRSCREEGLALSLHLMGPCAWDDSHTLDETVRLIREGRPVAASFANPIPLPGSRWWEERDHFGFRIPGRRMREWAWGAAESRSGQWGKGMPCRIEAWPEWRMAEYRGRMLEALSRVNARVVPHRRHLLLRSILGDEAGALLEGGHEAAFACGAFQTVEAILDAFNGAIHRRMETRQEPPIRAARTAVGN